MKLYFIRHGQSVANRDHIYSGQSDVLLSEQGRAEAAELIPFFAPLRFDKVFSSDLSRAMDTQKIALPGAMPETTPLLREIDVGARTGKPWGWKPEAADDEADTDGETQQDVKERLSRFLAGIKGKPWDTVAIFAHNGILNAMLRITLGDETDKAGINRNCAVLVFESSGNGWIFLEDESRK